MAFSVDRTFVFDGSLLSRSYADRQRGRAIVMVALSGGPDTSEAKSLAITAAVSEVGQTYPYENDELPLHHTQAKVSPAADGTTNAMVTLVFARGRHSPPLQDAFDFAQEYGYGERRKTIWQIADTTVTPTTYTDVSEGSITPSSGEFLIGRRDNHPAVQITVPTVLDTNPITSLAEYYGYVNSDDVVINGVTRDAYTLKFKHVRIQPADVRSGLLYVTAYVFDWFPAGYGYQHMVLESVALDGEANHHMLEVAPRLTVSFAGRFTTHDGTGPEAAP